MTRTVGLTDLDATFPMLAGTPEEIEVLVDPTRRPEPEEGP